MPQNCNVMFEGFEGHSRVWLYQANRELSDIEIKEVEDLGLKFLDDWNAHGKKLFASLKVLHRVFIVLVVDEIKAQATGCSIDKSVEFFRGIDGSYRLDLFNRFNFAYESGASVSIGNLQKDTSMLNQDTIVFNNLITKLEDLRSVWRVPVKDSWHKQFI